MTAADAGPWTPVFPRRSLWSTITYSKVARLGVTSLSPANGSDDKLVVIRAHQGTNLLRIPPGDAPWETRVRIIGPEVDLPPESPDRFMDPIPDSSSAVNDGRSGQAVVKIGDILSRSYSDTDSRSTIAHGNRTSPVYTIKGTDVDRMVIRTDGATQLIPATRRVFSVNGTNFAVKVVGDVPGRPILPKITDPPRKITIRPARSDDPKGAIEYATSVPISKIIIRDEPTQVTSTAREETTAPDQSSGPTHAWLPITQCAVRTLPDLLKDLAVLCTIKRRNIADIQLHVACHRFRVIRQLYDHLNKVSDLKLNLTTQTLTRTTHRRSNARSEEGQYEVCVRSNNSTSLLEAARICKEASEKAATKCSFRISTNTHTYN